MNEKMPYIDKDRILPESQDYTYLRAKGIEYIQQLASENWTDYNEHDPGITILEILCYAVSELGYRTGFPVKDILAEGDRSLNAKQFFTAGEILTCNPVTINDYRKILIDIEGIKNAWLAPADGIKPQIYADCGKSALSTKTGIKNSKQINLSGLYSVILEMEVDDELGNLNVHCFKKDITSKTKSFKIEVILPPWDTFFNEPLLPEEFSIINLTSIEKSQKYKGQLQAKFGSDYMIYECIVISTGIKSSDNKTLIENKLNSKAKDNILVRYREIIIKTVGYAKLAFALLHEHRNLCEDFYSIKGVDIEDIAVCADIEIKPDADPEETLADIYFRLENFFSPRVNFYTMPELKDKGKKIEEIFEGPLLKHGFIDEDELEGSVFKTVIHVSDIIQILMDVDGVVAVKNIQLSGLFNCEVEIESEKWCLKIPSGRASRLCMDNSKIVFYKGLIPYYANKKDTLSKLNDREALRRFSRLAKDDYDLKIPAGTDRHIEDYYSIQNEFPLCYGIGEEGLTLSETALRKAQAKQLKAYLLFYDRILANFFAQLAHTKDLFSLNPGIKKTYFPFNILPFDKDGSMIVPNLPPLLKDFVDTLDFTKQGFNIDDLSTYQTEWEAYINDPANIPAEDVRNDLLESEEVYEDRRNRFLDHLMARFAEQFTDYVMLMYTLDKKKAPSVLIEDKIAFLKDYPEISSNRGRAFNYKDPSAIWDTANVSGLKKRVSRLLGINFYERKTLSDCVEKGFVIYQENDNDGINEYRFRLEDKNGNILLSSSTHYTDQNLMKVEIQEVIKFGRLPEYFDISTTKTGKYYFNLLNDSGDVIARRIEYFNTKSELLQAVDIVIKYVDESLTECEGFHLVEHIIIKAENSRR